MKKVFISLLLVPSLAVAQITTQSSPVQQNGYHVSVVAPAATPGSLKLVTQNTNPVEVYVNGEEQLDFSDGAMSPAVNSDVDLGTAALSYEDIFTEKLLADNDSTSALDADVTTATTAAPLIGIAGTSATQSHVALVQNVASAQGADVVALKTRAAAGSTNANTIVASGDDILKIRAFGANGTSYDEAAQILIESGGTPGASADMPGQIRFLVSADGSATPAEALKIGPSGTLTFSETLIGTGTGTLGWAVVAGANTACTTTCTTPCVFGVNTAATEADIVACADATADECLCAGAT